MSAARAAAVLLGHGSRPLVLASASPRRRDLLRMLGLEFEQRIPDVDETFPEHADPPGGAEAVALRKAKYSASRGRALVLAADTVVCIDNRVLGKPGNLEESKRMLEALAGRVHTVYTGVAVLDELSGKARSGVETTQVEFAALTEAQLALLAETGDGMDKAGSYGIQSIGALAVQSIQGDYFNVVGLPLQLVRLLITAVTEEA